MAVQIVFCGIELRTSTVITSPERVTECVYFSAQPLGSPALMLRKYCGGKDSATRMSRPSIGAGSAWRPAGRDGAGPAGVVGPDATGGVGRTASGARPGVLETGASGVLVRGSPAGPKGSLLPTGRVPPAALPSPVAGVSLALPGVAGRSIGAPSPGVGSTWARSSLGLPLLRP